jgi:hypothetical protein
MVLSGSWVSSRLLLFRYIKPGDVCNGQPARLGKIRCGDRDRPHRQVGQVECGLEAGDAPGADELVEILGGDSGHSLVD